MTPEELQKITDQIGAQGLTLDIATFLILFVVIVIAGLLGGYLASYAKTKGKNFATKEDFDGLLAQLKEQTDATERIKDQIKQTSWLEQRRWDFKKELYDSWVKSLLSSRSKAFNLRSLLVSLRDTGVSEEEKFNHIYQECLQEYRSFLEDVSDTGLHVNTACYFIPSDFVDKYTEAMNKDTTDHKDERVLLHKYFYNRSKDIQDVHDKLNEFDKVLLYYIDRANSFTGIVQQAASKDLLSLKKSIGQ